MPIYTNNLAGSGGGTGDVTSAQLSSSLSTKADKAVVDAIQAQLPSYAPQTSLDALQAQVDALPEDVKIVSSDYDEPTRTQTITLSDSSTITQVYPEPPAIEIATDAEFTAGTETAKPPQVKQVSDALATKEDKLPIGANKYLQRNAADDTWEAVDISAVHRGTTVEKSALGIVARNTPFFDTDLGVLQYYKTSTENFIVNKSATDLPYTVEWASANSVFSAMRFKITTSLTDTVDNSVVNLPDGEDVLLYMIGRQLFNGSVAANTLGGAFTVRNDGGTLTLVSVEPTRHWSGGLDWTTASYQELTTEVTAPIGITIDDVNSILANVAGAGVWTSLEGGGTPAFSEIVEPFATDSASFPAEPADAAVDKAYLTVLTTDEIGTGTAENPEFRSGQYLTLGSGWIYYGSSTAIRPELTEAQLVSITDPTVGAVSGQSLFNRDFQRQGKSLDFTATNGQELIPKDWSAERLVAQFGIPTEDRVIHTGGNYALDPLTTLSNTKLNQYIRYVAVDSPITITPILPLANIAVWKDYSGNNIAQPTTDNEVFTIPADVTMTVHREGNGLKFVFFSNEGVTPSQATDQRVIANGLLEDRGIFRELDVSVVGLATGTITFPEGGFSSPPKVQATAETNGHTVNVRNITETQFTYDQWDVEDVKQGGNFTYNAKGEKP